MGKIKLILGASILLTCFSSVNAALITSGDKIKFDFDFSSDPLQPVYTYLPWGYDNFVGGEADPQAILWEPDKEVKLTIFDKDGIVEYESLYSIPLGQAVPDIFTIFGQVLAFNDTLGSFQLESIDAEFSMLNFKFQMCKQLQDGSNDCTNRLEFDEEAINAARVPDPCSGFPGGGATGGEFPGGGNTGGCFPGGGPSPVPAPAAIWLFGTGLIGLIGFTRRRKAA